MSDRITSAPVSQEQTVTTPVTTPVTLDQSTAPQDATPEVVAAAPVASAVVVTVEQCNRTLGAFGKAAAAQTEQCYTLASLATEYVRQCLAASPKALRETATERLAVEMYQHGEESLSVGFSKCRARYMDRVGVLLGCNAVVELLGDGRGVAKGDGTAKGRGKGGKDTRLPWGKLREFRPLVERQEGREERYAVVPHVEEEAKALLAEVATSGLSREDVAAGVAKLVAKSASVTAELLKQEEAARVHNARVEAERAAEAEKAAAEAEKAVAVAVAAVEASSEEGKPAAQAVANDALATLREAEKASAVAIDAATLAKQKAATVASESKVASGKVVEAQARAAVKEAAAEQRKSGKGGKAATVAEPDGDAEDNRPEPKAGNLLAGLAKVAKNGAPKDVAEGIADAIRAASDPYALLYELAVNLASDEALDALLTGFDHSKGKMGDAAQRAVKGARLALTVKRQTIPTPSTNGNHKAAVA